MRILLASSVACVLFIGGCGNGDGPGVDLGADLTAAPKTPGIAVVRGKLQSSSADGGSGASKATHDGIVMNIKSMVMGAGDTGHTVFLGLADPTTFLSVDSWNDLAAAKGVYASAAFQAAFGQLLSGAPTIDYYVVAPGFSTYGTIKEASNGLPSFGFVVEGTLKETDPQKGATAHNMVLDPNKARAMALTDVAHVPFLKEGTTSVFFNVDIWKDPAKAQAFFMDPNVAAAFAGIFSQGPAVTPYSATDWAQW